MIPESEKKLLADIESIINERSGRGKFSVPFVMPELIEWKEFNVGFLIENGHITKLNLTYLRLTELPNSIGDLKELKYLDLLSNSLKSLPESFKNLTNLEHLQIPMNGLTSLPEWLGDLKNLRTLILPYNKLQTLPESIGNLENLRRLDLCANKLHFLPECMENLKNLRHLSLEGNKFDSLPDWVKIIENLRRMELEAKNFTSKPESFRNLKKITKKVKLNIPDSEKFFLTDFKFPIPELAEWKEYKRPSVGFLIENGHISKLMLFGRNLTVLPDSIGNLKELRYLGLNSNLLKNLPNSFQNLINLEYLGLERNNFTSLPDWFGNLKNLLKLYLADNKLHSLPDRFGNLVNLEFLGLGGNNFTSLPDCLEKLKNLRDLRLWNNKLHSLPDWFGNLKNLKNVELGGNNIPLLPESFRNLKNLIYIGFENTGLRSFSNIPEEIIDHYVFLEDLSWLVAAFCSKGNYPSKEATDNIGNILELMGYYHVSPLDLAQKYALERDSLSLEEKNRLAWEGGFRERDVIEMGGINSEDPVLAEINKRFTFTSDSGLKLMK